MATERKVPVTFRCSPSGLRWMDDDLPAEVGVDSLDRTLILRAALTVARRHLPELIELIKEQT